MNNFALSETELRAIELLKQQFLIPSESIRHGIILCEDEDTPKHFVVYFREKDENDEPLPGGVAGHLLISKFQPGGEMYVY